MKTLYLIMFPILTIGQTSDEVYKELISQEVKCPEIVLAQSILETGWYECTNCSMDVNNIFGLWDSRNQRYFPYKRWEESIGGYLRGIQYKYNEKDYKDYYDFLSSLGYAEDPDYINKLKKKPNIYISKEEFRKRNLLDYKLYKYAIELSNKQLSSLSL